MNPNLQENNAEVGELWKAAADGSKRLIIDIGKIHD